MDNCFLNRTHLLLDDLDTGAVESEVRKCSVLGPVLYLIYHRLILQTISLTVHQHDYLRMTVSYSKKSSPLKIQNVYNRTWTIYKPGKSIAHGSLPYEMSSHQYNKKRKSVLYTFTKQGYIPETVENAKYLGLHLHKLLNKNMHINKVVRMATSTSAFIKKSSSKS